MLVERFRDVTASFGRRHGEGVEAVEAKMEEDPNLSPKEAARVAMGEITAPIIAITLVLLSVFIPTAFIPGITGQLYQQFAVTIAISVCFSALNALTLSPALASLLCGLSRSLETLIVFRIMQGFCGGPIMPMSQTLMTRIFPPEKASVAMIIWAMTTTVAPIAGPILGGTISDNVGWEWIFFINVPVAMAGGIGLLYLFRGQIEEIVKARIDVIGLILMIIWVGALQIMLDKGKELDWFHSGEVMALGVVALGSSATLDTAWDGPIAQSLRQFAEQLSADLGWRAR